VANTGLLLTGVAIILKAAPKPLRWAYKVEVVALTVMAILMFQAIPRYLGWIDIESTVLRLYHIPVMLLAIGAAIFDRHVLAVWRTEQANVELDRRVQEKARAIETYHAEREEVMRQQALAGERHRILTDMHDGLGASLVGLLRYVQSKPGDAQGIEQRVKEALQEMRIAIDALEPAEGDLAAVLGKLRFRLAPMMEATGVYLVWEVSELPSVEALDPSAVFAIQRAVLEALSNALKHSGARHIRLTAHPREDGIEIRIEDDGKGFRPDHATSGLGLSNMRSRIERLGGRFEITSRTGRTCVIFTIPYTVSSEATPAPERTMIATA
jgi:signal transduction histidine kinase